MVGSQGTGIARRSNSKSSLTLQNERRLDLVLVTPIPSVDIEAQNSYCSLQH